MHKACSDGFLFEKIRRGKKIRVGLDIRSVPLRLHYDAFCLCVYQVVERMNLDSRELPWLIESIDSILPHEDRS